MYTICHWIFMIWFVHWFSIEFSWICRFNNFLFFIFYKSKRLVHLIYIIFHWILTILYFQQNQISQQVQTICASNVHNFPLNFHDLVRSSIFHRVFTNFFIEWIRFFLQIWCICISSHVHNFPLNFHDFVHSTKLISQHVWTICPSDVPNFPLNFHDLVHSSSFHLTFTNLYTQRIRIFLLIWTICTSNLQIFHWIFTMMFLQ